MIINNTPVEYFPQYDLDVKREDLCCPYPGPPFSKTRGVFAHLKKRPEKLIGVLDTFHSQGGHAVAMACKKLKKKCINYYPIYKADGKFYRPQQMRSMRLGAELRGIPAGRSAILFHQAKKDCVADGGYMVPNALKLPETIAETAKEVHRTPEIRKVANVIISISSATIASGVIKGLTELLSEGNSLPRVILHMGYSRSQEAIRRYIYDKTGIEYPFLELVDEGYGYKDVARPGPTPEYTANIYYDLKAFRWLVANRKSLEGRTMMWHIG